jgi:hypothetical protein
MAPFNQLAQTSNGIDGQANFVLDIEALKAAGLNHVTIVLIRS